MHDLVPFVQFKKHEKHRWRSLTFSIVAGLTLLRERFSRFLNCTNGTKLTKASQMLPDIFSNCSYRVLENIKQKKNENMIHNKLNNFVI